MNGTTYTVINPRLFRSAPVAGLGLGLFCDVSLEPGDIWWAHDMDDPRYVERVIPWSGYLTLHGDEKADIERRCYVDGETRAIVVCAEPFCRVNHGNARTANCGSDAARNSVVLRPIAAGEQLLISYEYEAVISLVWKFDAFRAMLPQDLLQREDFLFSEAIRSQLAMDFLNRLP